MSTFLDSDFTLIFYESRPGVRVSSTAQRWPGDPAECVHGSRER
eukprot:CAMPEP_0173372416 /NCGR_PEP_ID=MMETSP1144-20121109/27865_1 /TAXON_ID=483371 /ORGANISM="non described non described, Strain CCMP2298" /LENGTH=43 /DNA_ID= /DNA_START= /DNA_END= /DNA_ORIENTATION=